MKKKYTKKILVLFVVLLIPLGLCQCQKKESIKVQMVTQSDIAMGTLVSANIYTTGSEKEGTEIAQKSNGALDPTIGELSRLWDIDGENPKVPTQEEIDALLREDGYKNVTCNNQRVLLQENTSIDLGAVGKGIGCDEAYLLLKQQKDVTGAVVSVGGSILTYGSKDDGSPWGVAVTDPMYSGENYMGVLSLEGENYVSTSGDYEKYFEQDGVRYHHILNPKTGYPAESGLVSVTVVTKNGLLSDGLSTACFVLGLTDGMKLIEEYQAEAVFIDKNQNVYVSEGLKDKFTITEEDVYHLQELEQ